jgi:4-oxalomesaconate hydratase
MATIDNKHKTTMLVISAHSADFVWRAGGAIALYAQRGYRVCIACLTYGERGESAKLWKQPGMTLERVKAARQKEAEKAASVLGGETIFFDAGDYPLRPTESLVNRLVGLYRDVRPEFVLTHSLHDPYNFDHPETARLAQEARIIAQAHGHPGKKVIGAPPVFLFEPHQPEQCQWEPNVLLDITEVWDLKRKALSAWRRRNISGSTIHGLGCSVGFKPRVTRTATSSTRKAISASFHRLQANYYRAEYLYTFHALCRGGLKSTCFISIDGV